MTSSKTEFNKRCQFFNWLTQPHGSLLCSNTHLMTNISNFLIRTVDFACFFNPPITVKFSAPEQWHVDLLTNQRPSSEGEPLVTSSGTKFQQCDLPINSTKNKDSGRSAYPEASTPLSALLLLKIENVRRFSVSSRPCVLFPWDGLKRRRYVRQISLRVCLCGRVHVCVRAQVCWLHSAIVE